MKRKKGGFLICFTGVDGSGKTTHAKALVEYFKHKGYSCTYIWGAWRPVFSYIFYVFTRFLGYWKMLRRNSYTDPLSNAHEEIKKKLSVILRLLIFLDFHIKVLWKIRIPLMIGKCIVCDRYFYDLIMELERSNILSKRFTNWLCKTMPRPLITFLIDAPGKIISSRRDFSIEEIQAKRKIFRHIARNFSFIIIDSSNDYADNQSLIRHLTVQRIESAKPTSV